jgi:hypothetical protein
MSTTASRHPSTLSRFGQWVASEFEVIRSLVRTQRDSIAASSLLGVPICAVLAVGMTWGIYVFQDYSGEGEPFSWFNGTSAWPSIGMIILAGLLSVHFILKVHFELKTNALKLTETFSLNGPKNVRNAPLFCWEFPRSETRQVVQHEKVQVLTLWQLYQRLSRFKSRLSRSLPMVVLYIVALFIIQPVFGSMPTAPIRGAFNFQLMILLTVVAFLALTFLVIDAIFLHEGFLKQLVGGESQWPRKTGENFKYPAEAMDDHGENLADYWDILLIARRTQAVGNQIYYPFIILSLLIVARLNCFDNWTWSRSLVVVISMHFLLAFYAAWRLPKIAKQYRDDVLGRMKRRQRQAFMREKRTPEAIDTMIEEVQTTHQGAFAFLWEQPAIRALLLPSGGIGLLTLLQYLPQ